MKGINLTSGQVIIIGSVFVFGLPIGIGLVVWHFLGFWMGVAAAGLVLGFIAYMAKRWAKRTNKPGKGN